MQTPLTEKGEAALHYGALGYAVFPIYEPAAPGVCSCGCTHPHCWERAKHPRIPDREQTATTDPETIRRWWTLWPEANVGIACRRSGVIVIDVDLDPDGGDRLPALRERFGPEIAETLTTRTGSGGWHLYYRVPPDFPVKTLKGRLGPGVDVQAFATAPPSVHSNMGVFAWHEGRGPDTREPAPLPDSLATALARKPSLLWYAGLAPYWLADRVGLSMGARRQLRRVEALPRRLAARFRR